VTKTKDVSPKTASEEPTSDADSSRLLVWYVGAGLFVLIMLFWIIGGGKKEKR
jgi:hypothetical protein